MEYGVSEGNVIGEDIIIGFLFYFLRDIFDLYEFVMVILEGMFVSTSAPNCGLSKAKVFLLGLFVCLYWMFDTCFFFSYTTSLVTPNF